MKKILLIYTILTALLVGCAGTSQKPVSVEPASPLLGTTFLLKQLPANDATEELLLLDQLVKEGPEEIARIILQLESADTAQVSQAKFVLHGLTRYAARSGQNEIPVEAFGAVLNAKMSKANKLFVMAELQKIAGVESVPLLAGFLDDEYLCEPACRALVTIGGSPSITVLRNALTNNTDANRVHIIQALGQLGDPAAGEAIMGFAENRNLKPVVLRAQSNLAFKPAADLLRSESATSPEAAALYVNYASNLAKSGDIDGLNICTSILNGDYPPQIRLSALTVLLDQKGEAALDQLTAFVQTAGAKERMGALRAAESLNNDRIDMALIDYAGEANPEVAADILCALTKEDNSGLASSMLRFLVNENAGVRLAAAGALPILWGADYGKNMFYFIDFPGSKTTPPPGAASVDRQKMVYSNLADDIQLALARQLADHRIKEALPFFRSQASMPGEIGLTGLEAIGNIGDDNDVDLLLPLVISDDSRQARAAQAALATIVEHSPNRRAVNKKIDDYFAGLETGEQEKFLPLYRQIGDNHALARVQSQLASDNGETAAGLLASWPGVNALPVLVTLAEESEQPSTKEKLLRGVVRLINQSRIDGIAAFDYCQRLFAAADNSEQKKMVIAQMGKINTPQSLRFLSGLLSDEELGQDAARAITDELSTEGDPSPAQVAASLIEGSANGPLRQSLEQAPLVESKLNKPPRGFAALFNGRDLSGWKGLVADPPTRAKMTAEELAEAQKKADEEMRKHWKVVDGVLYFDGKGHSLCTNRDYRNFEMLVDWKIEKHGDSGIYLRGSPQVQIWDTADWPEGSGGLYNNKKNPSHPLAVADKPVGEWNTFRIKMVGERVTVYLNDVLVVDNVVMENYWERDKPIYPTGQIELQAHSTPLYFRNIFIRELPDTPEPFSGPLFNGRDLTGWHVVSSNPESWKVEKGILYTEGKGGGYIYTDREFADFELELEFRLPPNGNSGVGIRTPGSGDPAYVGMEIQVLDDYGDKYTNLKPWQYTGSIYGVQPPSKRVTKNAGQWQTMKIVCKGPKVDVYVNGEHTVDANLIEHMDKEKGHPGLKRRSGHIGLQNHSTRIEYRNIYLKEL